MSANEHAEDLRADSADEKNCRGEWHAHEEFDLMMKDATVVKYANNRNKSCADQDAHNLGTRRSIECKENRDDHRGVHCHAAEKGNGCEMDLARSRQIHD